MFYDFFYIKTDMLLQNSPHIKENNMFKQKTNKKNFIYQTSSTSRFIKINKATFMSIYNTLFFRPWLHGYCSDFQP